MYLYIKQVFMESDVCTHILLSVFGICLALKQGVGMIYDILYDWSSKHVYFCIYL